MKKIVFSGCSFTAGNGWLDIPPDQSLRTEVKDSPYLWTNLCHQNIRTFSQLNQINIAKGGNSNTEIFEATVDIISKQSANIDTLFCQWTSGPRYNFNVGFELWDTGENFFIERRTDDVNLNRGDSWSREYLSDLLDRLRVLHHQHWEILKIVRYSNIITRLAEKNRIKLFFINGLCPWDKDYFIKLTKVKPESYTEFTKKHILNIDSRDDQDIYRLYDLAHDHYHQAGGINEKQWINLYNSFYVNRTDRNFDDIHPGKKSNQMYFEMIKNKLEIL